MKNPEEIIKEWHPDIDIIRKDIGNRGYYIKYKYKYKYYIEFISINRIINHVMNYENNERKKKLLALEIINKY